MLRFSKFFRIRIPDGPMHLLHILNLQLETSRKSTNNKDFSLVTHLRFWPKILRFSICQVFWVNRARWSRIRQYFCNPRISYVFPIFENGQKPQGLLLRNRSIKFWPYGFKKKFEKYKKNARIVKIISDSVFTGLIYHPTWKIKNRWDVRFGFFWTALLKNCMSSKTFKNKKK